MPNSFWLTNFALSLFASIYYGQKIYDLVFDFFLFDSHEKKSVKVLFHYLYNVHVVKWINSLVIWTIFLPFLLLRDLILFSVYTKRDKITDLFPLQKKKKLLLSLDIQRHSKFVIQFRNKRR